MNNAFTACTHGMMLALAAQKSINSYRGVRVTYSMREICMPQTVLRMSEPYGTVGCVTRSTCCNTIGSQEEHACMQRCANMDKGMKWEKKEANVQRLCMPGQRPMHELAKHAREYQPENPGAGWGTTQCTACLVCALMHLSAQLQRPSHRGRLSYIGCSAPPAESHVDPIQCCS